MKKHSNQSKSKLASLILPSLKRSVSTGETGLVAPILILVKGKITLCLVCILLTQLKLP